MFFYRYWLVILIVIVLLIVIIKSLYIVQQQQVYVIERLGKFHKMSYQGLHIKVPFIDRIVAKLSLRTMDVIQNLDMKTKDNVTISMEVVTQYHVGFDQGTDTTTSGVYKAYYMLANPVEQMQAYIADALRASAAKYTLDETYENKVEIAQDVQASVSEIMADYGYEIVSTLITNIRLPQTVANSMNEINAAQREKQAAQDLAEADRIKRVTEAQAEAEAMKKTGEGIAEQRIAIAHGIKESLDTIQESGVTEAEANELFLFTQWVEMMRAFAESGKSSTVVLPQDFNETRSLFSQMVAAQTIEREERSCQRVDGMRCLFAAFRRLDTPTGCSKS